MKGDMVFGDNVYIDDSYMDENWKHIFGFPEYWVSDQGRIWSSKSQRFLKLKPMDDHGHMGVCLCRNGSNHYRYIHRLVAEAFIPNPNHYPVVRHITDDPEFNSIYDLSWGTTLDNVHDCIRNGKAYSISVSDREKGLQKLRTPIRAIDILDQKEQVFDSQGEASRALHIPQGNIFKVLNHERTHAQKYTFSYLKRGD